MKTLVFFIILLSSTFLFAQIDDFLIFQQLQFNSPDQVNYDTLKKALNLKDNFNIEYAYQNKELKFITISFKKTKEMKSLQKALNKQYGESISINNDLMVWVKNGVRFEYNNSDDKSVRISLAKFNSNGKLDFSDNVYILDYRIKKVYNNGKNQELYILGSKDFADSPGWNHCYLYIDEGDYVNESLKSLPAPHNNAYDPHLDFYKSDFDCYYVIVKSFTGGSGGIINVMMYSFINSYPVELFNSDDFKMTNFTGKYLDDYKALIYFSDKDSTQINLKHRKKILLENGIYENNKLINEIELWGNALVDYKVKSIDDSTDCLVVFQEVRGFANIDRIALIENTLTFKDNKWSLIKRRITPY